MNDCFLRPSKLRWSPPPFGVDHKLRWQILALFDNLPSTPLRWYFLPINVYKKSNILENLVLPTSFLRSLWTPPLLVGKFNLMHNECKVAGWCKSAYPTHFIKVTCLSSRMDDVHGGLFSRKNWPKNQLSDPKYIHSFKCCSGNFLFSVLKLV